MHIPPDRDTPGALPGDGVLSIDSEDTVICSFAGRLVAVIGLRDTVVIDSQEGLFVRPCPGKARVGGPIRDSWGLFTVTEDGPAFTIARIVVWAGASVSLLAQHGSTEHWVVVRGEALVKTGDRELRLGTNHCASIAHGIRCDLSNPGPGLLEIVQVLSGGGPGRASARRFELGEP